MLFQWSLPFSGVTLLNWFTKSSNFEEGFNDNYDYFLDLSTVSMSVMLLSVLVQEARKFLLFDKELKGKIAPQHSMECQDSSQF